MQFPDADKKTIHKSCEFLCRRISLLFLPLKVNLLWITAAGSDSDNVTRDVSFAVWLLLRATIECTEVTFREFWFQTMRGPFDLTFN